MRTRYSQGLAKNEEITVLPSIEFLSDARGAEPIHFIGIFSEDSDIEYIWSQISNRTLIREIKGKQKKHDEVYCDLHDTINLIKKELGGIVSIHAGKKSNSLENITHSLPHGDAQKQDIATVIDIFEMGKEKDIDDYRKIVFPSIKRVVPMIICSDNHDVNKYEFKQKLWIKADPTFKGLQQAINEPEERFFIGEEPDIMVRVKGDKTRYIKSVSISSCPGKELTDQIWFKDLNIPISKELTAIIGNKGSGKSAIADIVGLCSDAKHQDDYQFLNANTFKKKGFAERFEASVEFESGIKTEPRILNYKILETDEPKVQYLPQNYYETVCNEIGNSKSFRAEIEKVVFQYVKIEDRLNAKSFQELISLKTASVNEEILSITTKISALNKTIISLEDKKNPFYKNSIESKLKLKNEELTVHEASLPQKTQNESLDNTVLSDNGTDRIRIEEFEKLLAETDARIRELNKTLVENNLSIQQLAQLKREIQTFHKSFNEFSEAKNDICKKFSLNISVILSLSVDMTKIETTILELGELNRSIKELLGAEMIDDSMNINELQLIAKKKRIEKEIAIIKSKLSLVEQAHEKYLSDLKQWEEKKQALIGSPDIPESIEYYKHERDYINNQLASVLNENRAKRIDLSIEIYSKKAEIKRFYDEIKSAISSLILLSECQNLKIESSLILASDFSNTFLSHILQNKSGSFYNSEDGKKYLKESILQSIDWNVKKSVSDFLVSIIEVLENDKRDKFQGDIRFIGEQIKNRERFYDYVFSLEYLNPVYELQKDGKNIEVLSPGEKGALLLVFYLVLDQSTIPLVIDQPEDNLDNNSVAKVLVPFIRKAKKRRQIIMVTHNPNLAVVADAEQVIRVNINKEEGNKFSYISGSIENQDINRAIVDVLEGTMPAFNTRKKKYHEDGTN